MEERKGMGDMGMNTEDYLEDTKIKRICIDGEEVCLAKSKLGYSYRVVHPAKDSKGKINYWNLFLGGKSNAIRLLIYLVIIVLLYVGITELISGYQLIAENPCKFCEDCAKLFIDKYSVPT